MTEPQPLPIDTLNPTPRTRRPVTPLGAPLMTLPEVATYLQVPESTVRDWRLRGVGPTCHKIGGHLRYKPEDVEAFVEAGLTIPAASPSRARTVTRHRRSNAGAKRAS